MISYNTRRLLNILDPIQSVKGKVVIDAFRTINTQMIMLGQEPRQTTSNLGHLQKPSIQGKLTFVDRPNFISLALIHGLNRHYYSMPIVYRKNEHEQQMLMNLHKSKWQDSLSIADFEKCKQKNIESINNMVKLAKVRSLQYSGVRLDDGHLFTAPCGIRVK